MVKTSRINTVSFSYSSIAKNSLVVKPGDLLTLVDGDDGKRYIDIATPSSIIFWICDDKASFPETNETKEKFRVNYTPVAWDNTYKMDKSWDWDVKVGYFYKITNDWKIDVSTASASVGQLMVQDIYDSYIEVRFVSNQGLFVPQYEDTKLVSVEETNPDSDPFDGLYTFTLSDWTEISGDFSKLAWYLGDVEITGDLLVDQDLHVTGNGLVEWDFEVSWDTVVDMLTAADTNVTSLVNSGNSTVAGNESISWTLEAWATTVASLESEWDAHVEWAFIADWNTELGGTLEVASTATIWWNTSVTGNISATGNATVGGTLAAGNTTVTGTITSTGNISWAAINGTNANFTWTLHATGITTLGNKLEVTGNISTEWNILAEWSVNINHALDVDWDANVDGSTHLVGGLTSDGVSTFNGQVVLWPSATANQFVLQSQRNVANWFAGLGLDGKLPTSVLPSGIHPNFYYETTTQGSTTYQLVHTPISDSSIIVFTDSGTVLFPTIDYTCANGQITFTTMWASEYAIIRVVSEE